MSFSRIAILGPGVLGGSLALAHPANSILWARNPERTAEAENLGLQATTDLATATKNCDLIILAVPVGVMADLATRLLPHLSPGCLITDVGSIKTLPHQTAGNILSQAGFDFIGSHPMAGSEKKGLPAARPDLFQNAACIITNGQNLPETRCRELATFWTALGSKISFMDPTAHDQAVARISHFPHLLASLTATISLNPPDFSNLAGGGLRDTTRIAAGDPDMWAEILIENRAPVIQALREAEKSLREILAIMEEPDQEQLREFLAHAKQLRDQIPNQPS